MDSPDTAVECEAPRPSGSAWLWILAGWLLASAHSEPTAPSFDRASISARIPAPAPREPPPLDLDRLSPRELRRLPGIGEARALAIARRRWECGGIDVAGLDDVPGIGEATVERIRRSIDR